MRNMNYFSRAALLLGTVALLATACDSGSKTSDPQASGKADSTAEAPKAEKKKNGLTWQDFSSEPGRYTISIPGKPKEQTRKVPIPNGTQLDLNLANVEVSDAAYLVSYLDYPADLLGKVEPQKLLTQSLEGAVKNSIQGEITKQEEMTISGVPCRRFVAKGKVKAKNASAEGIFCLQDSRLYQVLAIGETKDVFPENAEEFLSSFNITKAGA
ncbi:MAG: hypothetical protein WA902_21070 [Thermosynechococcaceae cyanobacterium]